MDNLPLISASGPGLASVKKESRLNLQGGESYSYDKSTNNSSSAQHLQFGSFFHHFYKSLLNSIINSSSGGDESSNKQASDQLNCTELEGHVWYSRESLEAEYELAAVSNKSSNMINSSTAGAAAAATISNSSSLVYELEALNARWQLIMAILYLLTAITSLILNVITVIVLLRSPRSKLGKYLINLSVSDLLLMLLSIRKCPT